MPARAHHRRRRHQLQHKQQSRDKNEGDGSEVSQPIFFATSVEDEVIVSRHMPAILVGHIDDSSWNSFCDKLDEAIRPLGKMKKTMKIWCFYPLALFVPLIVVGLVTTAILVTQSSSSAGESMDRLLPLLFLIAFFAAIPWAVGMASYQTRCKKRANEEVRNICSETSASLPSVSFQAFIELRYIQVSVASDKANELEEGDSCYENDAKDETFSISSSSFCSANTADSSIYSLTPEEFGEAKKWRTANEEKTGKIYYFNEETKEVRWEHPLGFAEINARGSHCDGKTFIDSHGKDLEIFDIGPDTGVETSILFGQVSWETPQESDEVMGKKGKGCSWNGKGKIVYGEPDLDV